MGDYIGRNEMEGKVLQRLFIKKMNRLGRIFWEEGEVRVKKEGIKEDSSFGNYKQCGMMRVWIIRWGLGRVEIRGQILEEFSFF